MQYISFNQNTSQLKYLLENAWCLLQAPFSNGIKQQESVSYQEKRDYATDC